MICISIITDIYYNKRIFLKLIKFCYNYIIKGGEIMKIFEDILKKNNLKVTKGRLTLLEELNKSQVPMNTEEIFASADKNTIPSLTSLYRMLNELSDKGIIRKNLYSNGLLYYEFAGSEHRHYIVCSKCGKVSPIKECPISDFEKIAEEETGFKVIGHLVELKGVCPECQKN